MANALQAIDKKIKQFITDTRTIRLDMQASFGYWTRFLSLTESRQYIRGCPNRSPIAEQGSGLETNPKPHFLQFHGRKSFVSPPHFSKRGLSGLVSSSVST